jgi:hypothetical protein
MGEKVGEFEINFAGMNKACTFASRLKKAECSLRLNQKNIFNKLL